MANLFDISDGDNQELIALLTSLESELPMIAAMAVTSEIRLHQDSGKRDFSDHHIDSLVDQVTKQTEKPVLVGTI